MMPLNMAENGPATPLGEPPDAQPMTLAEACETFLGHIRRALSDGASREEMTMIGGTFKAVEMEVQRAMAAQSAQGAGPEGMAPEAGPSNETQDVGAAPGAAPTAMGEQYRQ